jgi:hypothetical protein
MLRYAILAISKSCYVYVIDMVFALSIIIPSFTGGTVVYLPYSGSSVVNPNRPIHIRKQIALAEKVFLYLFLSVLFALLISQIILQKTLAL